MSLSETSRGLGAGMEDPLRGLSTAAVFLNNQGRISLWGPEAESLLGYPAGDVCGTSAVDLLINPKDRDAATAARERSAAGGWDGVVALRHRDGHEVAVALSVRPAVDKEGQAGWSVSAADAVQIERARVDQAILEALFSQSPISVTVLDGELRHLWVNAATERICAAPAEQLIGRTIREVVPEAGVETEPLLHRVWDTGEPVVDFQFRGRVPSDPHRDHAWSLCSFRLTDPVGHRLGICQTYVEVTEGYWAQQRLALLAEASEHIGTTLDVVRTAQELADTAVPELADYVVVDLQEATVRGEEPAPHPVEGQVLLRRAGVSSVLESASEAEHPVGDTVAFHPGTPQARCLAGGRSVLVPRLDADEWSTGAPRAAQEILVLKDHSLMVVPLRARGITLGVALFGRFPRSQAYEEGDLSLAEDFCSRAAVCVDNARRYTREHATAVTLQRSLLPHDLPPSLALETSHRYLPAAAHAGAGGDWFDVLPLSGARVALVIGDVVGHDLHAAAIMGRLRTAVHTLADLDLDSEEVLTQLDDLVVRLIQEDPECLGATCVYAIYDPISRICTFSRAGHPPPALVHPDGSVELLHDIPPGPPLGVGGLPFEAIERRLSEGTLLAFYTDGLIEAPQRDTDLALSQLAGSLAARGKPLEKLCEDVVTSLVPEHQPDDVALLLARTRAMDTDRVVSWDLTDDPALVAQARALVTRQLTKWGLDSLAFSTELIVSELLTNAIRHAHRPIALRLIHAHALICEVSDGSLSAPHLRRARITDEGGRGLFLVAQLSSRWGARYHRDGKTIWAEQSLPPDAAPSTGGGQAVGAAQLGAPTPVQHR